MECDELRDFAYQTHPGCYVETGFCQLPISELWTVLNTVELRDLGIRQLLVTGRSCEARRLARQPTRLRPIGSDRSGGVTVCPAMTKTPHPSTLVIASALLLSMFGCHVDEPSTATQDDVLGELTEKLEQEYGIAEDEIAWCDHCQSREDLEAAAEGSRPPAPNEPFALTANTDPQGLACVVHNDYCIWCTELICWVDDGVADCEFIDTEVCL